MTEHQIFSLSHTEGTRLVPLGTHSGMDITIQNINDSGYVYIGGEGVTSASYGYRVAPGHAVSFELVGKNALYAISSDADMNIAVIKIGLEEKE